MMQTDTGSALAGVRLHAPQSNSGATTVTIYGCGGEHDWRHLDFKGTNQTHICQRQACRGCGKRRTLIAPRTGPVSIKEAA